MALAVTPTRSGVRDASVKSKSPALRTTALRIAGMERRKLKRAQQPLCPSRETDRRRWSIRDREIPGVMANPWAKPIPMACPHFNPWAGVSPFLSFLVNQRKVPVTANAAPTAAGVEEFLEEVLETETNNRGGNRRSNEQQHQPYTGTLQERSFAPRVNNHARQICAVDPQHRNECSEMERKVEGQRVSNDREPRLKKDQVSRARDRQKLRQPLDDTKAVRR